MRVANKVVPCLGLPVRGPNGRHALQQAKVSPAPGPGPGRGKWPNLANLDSRIADDFFFCVGAEQWSAAPADCWLAPGDRGGS